MDRPLGPDFKWCVADDAQSPLDVRDEVKHKQWDFNIVYASCLHTMNKTYALGRPKQIVANGVTAISAGDYHSLFLKSDGSLWGMGGNWNGPLGNGFTNKSITVPEQIYPSPQPVLTNYVSAITNLQFNASCQFGGTFYLRAGTNLTQPVSQWTPVTTNVINNRTNNLFSATLTNVVNASAEPKFYILQSQ